MLQRAVTELEVKLKDYQKSPENHPLYPDEWRKFWNRRYKELQAGKTQLLSQFLIHFLFQ